LFINLTPQRVFDLYPPLLLKGEGEEFLERGEAPLLPTLPLPLVREGGQGDRLPIICGEWVNLKFNGLDNHCWAMQ